MPDLSVEFGGVKLKNPLVAGAGPLAGTSQHIKDCADAGFGAICTKTTSYLKFMQRYPRPLYTLVDYPKKTNDPFYQPDYYLWLHREHNSVFTADAMAEIISNASDYCKERGTVIFGNIAGRSLKEWEHMSRIYEQAGCDALELNFCCPFPPADLVEKPEDAFMGISFTLDPELGKEVIERVKSTVNLPVFVKLSPDGGQFEKVAASFKEAGADGLTIFANNRVMSIDIETGKPVNYGPCAGSGPGFKPTTLRWVAQVAQTVDLPIMAGRGAVTSSDGIEFLMGGASAVQYCTPVMLNGLRYVEELGQGINKFMQRRGFENISQFQGEALKHIRSNRQLIEDLEPLYSSVDQNKCIGCKRCQEVCWYDAIKVARKAVIKKDHCVGCTICSQVCPVNAIEVKERDDGDAGHFKAFVAAHPQLAEEDIKEGKPYV